MDEDDDDDDDNLVVDDRVGLQSVDWRQTRFARVEGTKQQHTVSRSTYRIEVAVITSAAQALTC